MDACGCGNTWHSASSLGSWLFSLLSLPNKHLGAEIKRWSWRRFPEKNGATLWWDKDHHRTKMHWPTPTLAPVAGNEKLAAPCGSNCGAMARILVCLDPAEKQWPDDRSWKRSRGVPPNFFFITHLHEPVFSSQGPPAGWRTHDSSSGAATARTDACAVMLACWTWCHPENGGKIRLLCKLRPMTVLFWPRTPPGASGAAGPVEKLYKGNSRGGYEWLCFIFKGQCGSDSLVWLFQLQAARHMCTKGCLEQQILKIAMNQAGCVLLDAV